MRVAVVSGDEPEEYEKTLLALYADGGALRFRVGRYSWIVSDETVSVQIAEKGKLSQCVIQRADAPAATVMYFPGELRSSDDFIAYVAGMLAEPGRRQDLVRRWTATRMSGKTT
jgi:hypothetical protein